jgi:hypothetical protein
LFRAKGANQKKITIVIIIIKRKPRKTNQHRDIVLFSEKFALFFL